MSLRGLIEELERGEGKESKLLREILRELEEVEQVVKHNTKQLANQKAELILLNTGLSILRDKVDTILFLVRAIAREIFSPEPVNVILTQGDTMPVGTIKGLVPGGTDSFFATPVDADGTADVLPSGSPVPTFTSDNPGVVIATSADGLSAGVTAPADAVVGTNFNLTWDVTYTNPNDGTPVNINRTVQVPVLAPPSVEPVDVVISQGAPAV